MSKYTNEEILEMEEQALKNKDKLPHIKRTPREFWIVANKYDIHCEPLEAHSCKVAGLNKDQVSIHVRKVDDEEPDYKKLVDIQERQCRDRLKEKLQNIEILEKRVKRLETALELLLPTLVARSQIEIANNALKEDI